MGRTNWMNGAAILTFRGKKRHGLYLSKSVIGNPIFMQSCYFKIFSFPHQMWLYSIFCIRLAKPMLFSLSVLLCNVDIIQCFSMFLIVQDICHYQACLLIIFLSMPSSSVCPPFYILKYFEHTTTNVMHVLIWSGLQMLDMFFTNGNLVDKKQKLLHVFLSVYLTSEK